MEALESLGIKNVNNVDYYTVRTEGEKDVLKIYYKREKGAIFHKSEKFKFARSSKPMKDFSNDQYAQVTEVSPMLVRVMAELDVVTKKQYVERTAKEKILSDLRHLEKVVANKVSEIERELDKL